MPPPLPGVPARLCCSPAGRGDAGTPPRSGPLLLLESQAWGAGVRTRAPPCTRRLPQSCSRESSVVMATALQPCRPAPCPDPTGLPPLLTPPHLPPPLPLPRQRLLQQNAGEGLAAAGREDLRSLSALADGQLTPCPAGGPRCQDGQDKSVTFTSLLGWTASRGLEGGSPPGCGPGGSGMHCGRV